jgi:bifunctional non-homologous end joining protein LigD
VFPRPFILPAQPTLRASPPRGEAWLHEVKFDGWRIQLHKTERGATIFTRNGHDYTRRLPAITGMVASLPVRSCVIDGELTACDEHGLPDFRTLHFRDAHDDELCVWAFDLLMPDGKDIRPLPLIGRKNKLARLVYKTRDNGLRYSENFDDGAKLLASCEQMGLEGVVSKKRDAPYRSGKCDWIKVKCQSWREANKNRADLFNKEKRR